jgi:hypothetical protein
MHDNIVLTLIFESINQLREPVESLEGQEIPDFASSRRIGCTNGEQSLV